MQRLKISMTQLFRERVKGRGVGESTFKGWINRGAKCAAIASGGESYKRTI
jgi:hypothetical protein